MDALEKFGHEKELLGFYLSGHPVDTLGGLGELSCDLKAEDLENLQGKRAFRLCGVIADLEKRFTKKDARPWARFNVAAKERDYSLAMFSEAFEQYGAHLVEGGIVIVEGVASPRNGETRMNVNTVLPVAKSFPSIAKEVTWLLDPVAKDTDAFLREINSLAGEGRGSTQVHFAFAVTDAEEALVVEADSRFTLRLTLDRYKDMRSRPGVIGARVELHPPPLPEEPSWQKRKSGD